MSESMQPGVQTGSLWNMPAVGNDVAYGVLEQRDSDIFSFLAGSQPRTPADQGVLAGGPAGLMSASMGVPSMTQAHTQSCGAAQGIASEIDLLQPQTRSAMPLASVAAPSTAELNMVLKTLQTLVPEFPRLEAADPGTRARRLQQWLQQVSQAIEPAGHHVMSWWQWVRTSAETNHRVFLTQAQCQREKFFHVTWCHYNTQLLSHGCVLASWLVSPRRREIG